MPSARVHPPVPPSAGHPATGGPGGITADSRSILRDGRRWLPVMGEFHFSRYPAHAWREELLAMRAGGLDTVATYLFWNQHEERRGRIRFDGDLDIRRFVRLCGETGLAAVVRIGPWAHGECRNGGFPDWLADEDCVPRTDDPAYLALVRPYFAAIARELRGLSHHDGGPVVGVQVENELYDQPGHIATLRRIAEEAGLRVPLWTATAWGAADLPEDAVLPLYGGYPEAFWEDAGDGWARGMRRHYFFTPIRDDHAIGADLRPEPPAGGGRRPDDRRHPYATCELGGGMAIAYHRRPLVPAADVSALALSKLGSGSVWQGYYLYHGVSQRRATELPNQESHVTGYPNDLPAVTYDFQAPLGEWGQARPSYHALRAQHLFLEDCGTDLAGMPLTLPDELPPGLDDRAVLRWSVRSDGERAFLFVNNHQPHEPLPDHHGVRFTVEFPGRAVTLPAVPVTVPSGAHFVWPVGHDLGRGLTLTWAAAQPVTRLDAHGTPLTVLAATAGITPQLALPPGTAVTAPADTAHTEETPDATLVTVTRPGSHALLTLAAPDGGTVAVLVLDAGQAAAVHRVRCAGADRVALCPDLLLTDPVSGDLVVRTEAGRTTVALYPAPASLTGPGCEPGTQDGVFFRWTLTGRAGTRAARVECVSPDARPAPARTGGPAGRASAPDDAAFEHAAVFRVTPPAGVLDGAGDADDTAEVLLRVALTGDAARAYVDGELVADHFWYGPAWEIGLRRHAAAVRAHGVEIRVLPLAAGSAVHVDPSARAGLAAARTTARVHGATCVPLHRFTLHAS
ncbi:beta-galactosidase [Streptomyces sp. RFCAC02]|uniref:beta-galactosidase n=1 Tax=Streptomyces sp. RFCAC02 TaxID=2499143 RepID=UPI001020CAB9|nr:beta-galactosidase [Streptomyces sp. RFCAC02]